MDQIKKILAGDLAELDKVYLEVKPKFMNYARRQFPQFTYEEIEDVYQDVIIAFYQNIKRGILKEINSNLSAYLIQIGKIKLIHLHESKKKERNAKEHIFANESNKEEYDHNIENAVKFIYSKMSDACKQILSLFYFEKKSMEEIALILDYKNADTVKSKKSRCISSFNSKVNNMYFDEE